MFGLNHLMDNALVGLALISVLVIFLGSVAVGILACFRPALTPNSNFLYVATAVAGLVLTVASGVLGKPATVQLTTPPSAQSAGAQVTSLQASFSDSQAGNFQQLYAWSYIVAGLICLVIFIKRTPATHDLVKSVALTTLGFLVTIVGGLGSQAAPASPRQLSQIPSVIEKQSDALQNLRQNMTVLSVQPKKSILF